MPTKHSSESSQVRSTRAVERTGSPLASAIDQAVTRKSTAKYSAHPIATAVSVRGLIRSSGAIADIAATANDTATMHSPTLKTRLATALRSSACDSNVPSDQTASASTGGAVSARNTRTAE